MLAPDGAEVGAQASFIKKIVTTSNDDVLSVKNVNSTSDFSSMVPKLTIREKTETPVTFSSTPDVDAIYDTIKKFVDSYNGIIKTVSDKISEKKSSGYPPLTEAQKEALSDDEVEKWEKMAKKGTMRNDASLNSLLTTMRQSIYSAVEGSSTGSMSKIGISTTKNYLDRGKLEIDEKKLRAAIEEDPNGIYNLFMANGEKTAADGTTKTVSFAENGVARRLRADLKTAMTNISEKAGSTSSVNNNFTLGRLLDDYEDKISAFEEKMKNLEDRYYKQFAAMETAINKANSQSAQLASYFTS